MAKIVGKAFSVKLPDAEPLIGQITDLARKARKEGMLALENEEIENEFLNDGIQMLIDGNNQEVIQAIQSLPGQASYDEGHLTSQAIFADELPIVPLYLRQDVSFQGMAFSFFGTPRKRDFDSDLEVEQAQASPETLQSVVEIDASVLGYRRPQDMEFFLDHQPLFLFRKAGRQVAYAFGCDGYAAGPAAAIDPQHLPALLHQIERSACDAGMDSLWLTVPAQASQAVDWALSCGYRIDPFYEVLLAREPSMQLDRFVMTQCAFIW